MRLRNWSSSGSVKADVFVVQREIVDAALGRRDPGGHSSRLDHFLHQRMHEGMVALRRDPVLEPALIVLARDQLAVRIDRHAGPWADRAAKPGGGEREPKLMARALDHPVPALEPDLAILEVGLAHHLIQG